MMRHDYKSKNKNSIIILFDASIVHHQKKINNNVYDYKSKNKNSIIISFAASIVYHQKKTSKKSIPSLSSTFHK